MSGRVCGSHSLCAVPVLVEAKPITPRMLRVRFAGPALAEFRAVSPDQQAKFFFAKPGQHRPVVPPMPADGDVMTWFQAYRAMPEAERPWMRSYTIRRHHADRDEIDVDFVLHEHGAGPATRWALRAGPGDPVGMLGPAVAHHVQVGPHEWRLLAGDESALPAIGALLEAGPAVPTVAFVEVADAREEQPLPGQVHWLHRDGAAAGQPGLLLDAVRAAALPAGPAFAWVAGEASAVRALRRHLVGERGIPLGQVAFCGYWRSRRSQDDELTEEDAAERAEVLAAFAEQGR
jgi:NADPH-dependent ferric siderophore reductase